MASGRQIPDDPLGDPPIEETNRIHTATDPTSQVYFQPGVQNNTAQLQRTKSLSKFEFLSKYSYGSVTSPKGLGKSGMKGSSSKGINNSTDSSTNRTHKLRQPIPPSIIFRCDLNLLAVLSSKMILQR